MIEDAIKDPKVIALMESRMCNSSPIKFVNNINENQTEIKVKLQQDVIELLDSQSDERINPTQRKRSITEVLTNEDSTECENNESECERKGKNSKSGSDDSNTNNLDSGSRGGTTNILTTGPKQKPITSFFNKSSHITSTINYNSSNMNGGNTQVITSPNTTKDTTVSKEVNKNSNKTGAFSSDNYKASKSVSMNFDYNLLQVSNQELKKQLEISNKSKEQTESKINRLECDYKDAQAQLKSTEDRNIKLCKYLEQVYREMAIQEARRKRDRLALDSVRIGKLTTVRTGQTFNSTSEVWEEGYAMKDYMKRYTEFTERKDELEKRKKKLTQSKKRQGKRTNNTNGSNVVNNPTISIAEDDDNEFDLDILSESEAIRSHFEQLKRDEQALAEERRLLDSQKAIHQKELRICLNEERSRFYRDLPCLQQRYLLLSMLGRGGFSEVWKALDLVQLKEVAVKVHQLNPTWTDDRKQSYVKHVAREYTIHRDLCHPRVVMLYDVFEIDVDSFCTVLEYCKGIDLDERLKRQKTIPEKDARTIIIQILCGLKYLNTPSDITPTILSSNTDDSNSNSTINNLTAKSENTDGNVVMGPPKSLPSHTNRRKAVIHFDLKPANILFDEMGDVKITDFGLSKVIDDRDENTSLELTSQGAGTYWYLPPECFQNSASRISSKVDVWSLGVIFYQMLYGKRPFGDGKSQEKVLSEGIILNAARVEFPSDTKLLKISEEAKDFIRSCLTSDQRYRPDVITLCQHQYLKNIK